MRSIEQQDIDDWIEHYSNQIERKNKHLKTGWYREQNLPLQTYYSGKADNYAAIGRTQALNKSTTDKILANFSEAAKNILKCFSMTYNVNDLDYLGDKVNSEDPNFSGYGEIDTSEVNEIQIIQGLNYALIANDFTTAEQLAYWYQDTYDGDKMDPDVNRYAFAYKYAILGKLAEAQALLQQTIDECLQKKPTHPADINYFTLSMTLQGILMGSAKLFNEGLQMQLDFYAKSMTPADDAWDTEEEFFCDHAVALAKLALHHKLPVTVEHPLMPARLLTR